MMFTQLNRYLPLVVILAIALMLLGCHGNDPANPGPSSQAGSPIPDMTGENGPSKAALYGPLNPYNTDQLSLVLERKEVQKIVAVYERCGYSLAPEQSFLIEGQNDFSQGSIQFIVMEPNDAKRDEAALITCIRVGGTFRVYPAVFTTSEPSEGSGYDPVMDGVWMRPFTADNMEDASSSRKTEGPYSVNDPGGALLRPGPGFWNAFFDCLVRSLPGEIFGCFVSCKILPIGMHTCFVACASGVVLANLINCSIYAQQMSSKEKQEQ
ncbi:MAG: hypothetical protein ABIA59_02215 [Candidatus Latescibacterota bacterium]